MSSYSQFPLPFLDACDAAIWQIGVRLQSITHDFGHSDFPQDDGIANRNDLYKYVHCYFGSLYQFLSDPNDECGQRNRELVLKLTAEQLKRAVGLSHFYVIGRKLFPLFEKFPTGDIPSPRDVAANNMTCSTLDWLVGIYQFPSDVAKEWHRLITTGKDLRSFMQAAQQFFYSQLSWALVLPPVDPTDSEVWASVAMQADFFSFQLKPEEWNPICEQHMEDFIQEWKKLRTNT